MTKTQRWDWAIALEIEELNDNHLQAAYRLNWDTLCKFDSCRKNCKRILCLACFDRSWIDNDSANNSGYDHYDTTNCEEKRKDLKSFVGLKNLGATCYVNCLLQLWFHNPALRQAIYEWDKSQSVADRQHELVAQGMMIEECDPRGGEQSSRMSSKRPRDSDKSQSTPNKRVSRSQDENTNSSSASEKRSTSNVVSVISPQRSRQPRDNQVQTNPIEQLQLIFARLQFTNKKSIDPFNFIDSLALNATEQQDAQEFGNLFMEFLEKSFASQKNSFVSKIIQNQFCGRYSYATICDHCKHSSLSDSNFYELDLSIQNLDTLYDCLNEFFRPVPLDGQYNCSHCQKAQSAHRKIILKSLPPTLNLQLLRFVYDVQRNIRQKLNSYITFPEILDMNPFMREAESKSRATLDLSVRNTNVESLLSNGNMSKINHNRSNIYILTAVLIHRGSSPHSGHYIAHIKDRITKEWYKFNDDSVEKIGPQLQISADGESITITEDKPQVVKFTDASGKAAKLESKSLKSKTAYMLVYQAQDNKTLSYPGDHSDDWMLPEHLQTAVAEENSKSDEIFESLQIAKEVDQQIMDARKNQIRTIYDKLICRDPSDRFEFIDKTWIQRWLTNSSTSAKFPPIDNSDYLCIHGKLDFRKIDQVKCVRTEGADMLYKEFGGGPRLQDAMCRDCVRLEVRLIQLKERMKEDQKFITSQAKFKLDIGYDFADAYIVGKKSYRDWQALVMVQFEKSYPELLSRKRNQQASSDEEEKTQAKDVPKAIKSNQDVLSDSESDDEVMEKFVFNSDVLCEHNQLINDTSAWRIVPKEVWTIFKHYFGNDQSRPLIEHNANTIMCPECKRQEVEQQEIGDMQKQKASEQKAKLTDLFHNKKRASWSSMLPGDKYFAIERQFLTRWQKFIRNPCHQEQPTSVKNSEKVVCEHGKSLYNSSNSNPVLPECAFVLINKDELNNLKSYYPVDHEIEFSIDPNLADKKLKLYLASLKSSPTKSSSSKQLDNSGDTVDQRTQVYLGSNNEGNKETSNSEFPSRGTSNIPTSGEDVDMTEIDWSDCVISKPDFCSDCYENLKQDELRKLLDYETATIYITKVENPCAFGPQPNPNTNGSNPSTNENCDISETGQSVANKLTESCFQSEITSSYEHDVISTEEQHAGKRRRRNAEDEANDFVPPGAAKHGSTACPSPNSILRRTTRRNRNREQAYTIKPDQTLLQLKKEIFSRCQVLPVDQRLFLNDSLLDDNSKTMSELRIVPNCSLKLEVDRPIGDNIDLIEDEPLSRKSSAQPETGFKGSLLCSSSHPRCEDNRPVP